MGNLLSLFIGIPSIFILFMGGLTIMIITINNETVIWWNPITLVLWCICLAWLVAMLIYRRQRVSIRVLPLEIQTKSKEKFIIRLKGFIDTRHPEGLENLELWINRLLGIKPIDGSEIPHSVDSKPNWFDVSFGVTRSYLLNSMKEQNIGEADIAWILSANMGDYIWLYQGGTIPIGLIINGKIAAMWAEPKTKKTRQKRNAQKREEGGAGISEKQFDELIKKSIPAC